MGDDRRTLTLGGADYEVGRSRLGKFLELQVAAIDLSEAIRIQHAGKAEKAIFRYLRTVIPDLEYERFRALPWFDAYVAFLEIQSINRIPEWDKFAILNYAPKDEGARPAWDYRGRILYSWVHVIAATYHWSKAEIENLWPEEAAAYIQEIIAAKHDEREFIYSLSQVAYVYDRNTKKYNYRPLQMPAWMIAAQMARPNRVTRLRREDLPVGQVIYPKGEAVLQ